MFSPRAPPNCSGCFPWVPNSSASPRSPHVDRCQIDTFHSRVLHVAAVVRQLFHDDFVRTLNVAATSYASSESINVSLTQGLLDAVHAPASATVSAQTRQLVVTAESAALQGFSE